MKIVPLYIMIDDDEGIGQIAGQIMDAIEDADTGVRTIFFNKDEVQDATQFIKDWYDL